MQILTHKNTAEKLFQTLFQTAPLGTALEQCSGTVFQRGTIRNSGKQPTENKRESAEQSRNSNRNGQHLFHSPHLFRWGWRLERGTNANGRQQMINDNDDAALIDLANEIKRDIDSAKTPADVRAAYYRNMEGIGAIRRSPDRLVSVLAVHIDNLRDYLIDGMRGESRK